MTYRRRILLLAAACAACGGGGGDSSRADGGDAGAAEHPFPSDAHADADASDDQGADAPAAPEAGDAGTDADGAPIGCNPNADFGAPVPVAGLESDAQRGGPRLTPDELTIYFSWLGLPDDAGHAYEGLYVAQRPTRTSSFGTPRPLTALNGSFNNFDPTTLDQLTLYFSSNQPGTVAPKDIYVARRASIGGPFDPATDLASPINTPSSDDAQPFLTADGMELWFSSNRAPALGYDIYRAPIEGGVVGVPQVVTEVSSGTHTDWVPTLSADGLTLFFSSDRAGGTCPPYGPLPVVHVWTASRARLKDPFSNFHPVPSLNSASACWDIAGWLSQDGCRFYMSSTRPLVDGGAQNEQIYVAIRGR